MAFPSSVNPSSRLAPVRRDHSQAWRSVHHHSCMLSTFLRNEQFCFRRRYYLFDRYSGRGLLKRRTTVWKPYDREVSDEEVYRPN